SHEQSELQGIAAVVLPVTAEPKRAAEIGLDVAHAVTAIFRFYSRSAMIPNLYSSCAPRGYVEPRSEQYSLLQDGRLTSSSRGVTDGEDGPWFINDQAIQLWNESGIHALIELSFK